MTNLTPATVAETFFAALGRGDIPTVMAQFSDDVLWHQPGTNQFSGDHHGIGGVGALLGGMMEASAGSFQLAVAQRPRLQRQAEDD